MAGEDELTYLDTSALVKRYLEEPGSRIVDSLFEDAYTGVRTLAFSQWNLGEATGVFDKYRKTTRADPRSLLRALLREMRTLTRLRRLRLVPINLIVIKDSIEMVLKHHLHIADAVQIVSARRVNAKLFVTADKTLARKAKQNGLNILQL